MASRRAFLARGAALACWPALIRAQSWPAKPLRVIVPFPPGGTTDFVTRLVATEVSRQLGQPIVVENKPGASTVIGVDAVARAPADGHTLVVVANSFTVNHTLVSKLPYDTLRDLRPVALIGMSEHVLAAHPASGIRSLKDVVAARQGSLSYASFGSGTSAHLAGEMLKSALGVDIVHVPYKGQSPALADLLGGQVSMMFGNWPEFGPLIESGRLVALGMATSRRSVFAPGIPTLAEQGVPIESNSWSGMLAPAATADEVVARLNAEVNRALTVPTVADAFRKGGVVSLAASPDRFADFIRSEIARYAEVIRRANITAAN